VQNPSYTAPANDGYQDVIVTLTVTATCDGDDALVASDSTTLTVRAARVRFEDIGASLNLPNSTCSAWGDYDDDGYPDLYIGAVWGQHRCMLLHNDGDGGFTDVTVAMGLHTESQYWEDDGAAWGDFNNDGRLDLIVSGGNHNPILYRNDETVFTDIGGPAAGFVDQTVTHEAGRGVAWGDYDGDNWLDVYISYVDTNLSRLYRNNRDGTFTVINDEAGMEFVPAPNSMQSTWADYNNDGLLDLLVSRLRDAVGTARPPRLYMNNGAGTFTDMAADAGLSGIPDQPDNESGVAWGDYDNDGWLDLYLPPNHGRPHWLFHSNGDGTPSSNPSKPNPASSPPRKRTTARRRAQRNRSPFLLEGNDTLGAVSHCGRSGPKHGKQPVQGAL